MNTIQNTIPELRFSEFSGEWSKQPFKDLVKINQGLQIAIAERLTEKEEGSLFYITNEFLRENSDKKYFIKDAPKSVICNKDDILMTRTGNTGKVVTNVKGAFHNNFFRISYPKSINKDFLVSFLNLSHIQNLILRLAGTSTIPDLNHSDFYKIKFIYPPFPEQQKIAKFLTSVDTKIEHLTKKKSLLEQYKKGVMQQIFNQALRFKPVLSEVEGNENGNDFPEWEEARFDEVYKSIPTKKHQIKSSEILSNGKFKVVDQGKKLFAGFSNDETKEVLTMPVIIYGDHTTIVKYIDFPFIIGADGTKILISENNQNNLKYLYHYLQFNNIESEGYKRHFSILRKIKVQIPCFEEQTQIANFLSSIDKKIELVNTQLENTKEFKKGLLQQMFV